MQNAVYVCLFVSLSHFLVMSRHAFKQRIRIDDDVGFTLERNGVSSKWNIFQKLIKINSLSFQYII